MITFIKSRQNVNSIKIVIHIIITSNNDENGLLESQVAYLAHQLKSYYDLKI